MARSNTRSNSHSKPAKQLKSSTKKSAQTASRSGAGMTKHDRVLGLLRVKGGDHHCGHCEGHRLATALGTGLSCWCREEEAWTDASVREDKVRPHLSHH
jgi:hypothetical protein